MLGLLPAVHKEPLKHPVFLDFPGAYCGCYTCPLIAVQRTESTEEACVLWVLCMLFDCRATVRVHLRSCCRDAMVKEEVKEDRVAPISPTATNTNEAVCENKQREVRAVSMPMRGQL